MTEFSTSEVPKAINADFGQRLQQTIFEHVSPELSQETVKALYFKLQEKGQSYTADHFDFDSGAYMSRGENGGIFSISCQNEGSDARLSIFVSSGEKIIGYGGFTDTGTPGETQASFKIFPEGRSSPQAAIDLFNDHVFNFLATTESVPDRILVPPHQQFNPSLGERITGAALLYRRLGFSTEADSELPQDLQRRLKADRNGERVVFSPEELMQLSQNMLTKEVNTDQIEQIRKEKGTSLQPASSETRNILQTAISKRQEASTMATKPPREKLQALAKKLKTI